MKLQNLAKAYEMRPEATPGVEYRGLNHYLRV